MFINSLTEITYKMIVESKIQNFKQKLSNEVTYAPLIWFITPKKFNGKSFCGNFDSKEFDLVKNSNFIFLRQLKIRGNYQSKNNKTIVNYSISENQFNNKLFKILFLFSISILLILLFLNLIGFNTEQFFVFIIVSCFFIFASVIYFLSVKFGKKIVQNKFEEIFEIEK